MTKTMKTASPEVDARVKTLVEEVLAGSSHFLVELEVRGAPGSQAVDVFIDSDEGLGVDTLARISREVAFLFDAEEVLAGLDIPDAARAELEALTPSTYLGLARELTRKR